METKDILITDCNPSVYVGTYKKYNEGSLFGEWVDLTEFDSKGDFIDYCLKLHSDEESPELMYQDYENFPEQLYSESLLSDDLWDWMELDEDQQEILDAFLPCFGGSFADALNDYEDAYCGHYESFRDFCEERFLEVNEIPENLIRYIDYGAIEADYSHDYIEHNGHVFYRGY